jgi:hypothetical protein
MAVLPGDRLTAAYRRQQVQNAALLAARLRRQFGGVLLDSPASQRNFLDLATPEVIAANRRSADQAVAYLRALRMLEGDSLSTSAIEVAPPPALEQVRRSLAFTGVVEYGRRDAAVQSDPDSARGMADRSIARRQSATGVMGSGIRHAQNGARDTVVQFVERETKARGWVRVTAMDDKVCYFCAMLASRVDWKEDSFEDSDAGFTGDIGTAKVHDSCRCHLRPVYTRELPDETLYYRRAWSALSGGDKSAVNNFRSGWDRAIREGAAAA